MAMAPKKKMRGGGMVKKMRGGGMVKKMRGGGMVKKMELGGAVGTVKGAAAGKGLGAAAEAAAGAKKGLAAGKGLPELRKQAKAQGYTLVPIKKNK